MFKDSGIPVGEFATMQITFINNDGGGFASHETVTDGVSVSQFLGAKVGTRAGSDFLIRVNGQPATSDQALRDGDRVSITPKKVVGAGSLMS